MCQVCCLYHHLHDSSKTMMLSAPLYCITNTVVTTVVPAFKQYFTVNVNYSRDSVNKTVNYCTIRLH